LTTTATDRRPQWAFWLFLLSFFVVWTLRATLLFQIDASIGSEFARNIYSNAVKFLIWVAPVFLYLIFVDRVEPFGYLKLTTRINPRGLLVAAAVSAAYFAMVIAVSPLIGGRGFDALLKAEPANVARTLGLISISPLWEEILFRGFVLNKLSSRLRFFHANLLTGVLFSMAHWPYWLYSGMEPLMFARLAGNVFFLGVVFGYVFKKSNSIWPAVAVHIINNLLSSLLNN